MKRKRMPLYQYECKKCKHEFEWLKRNGNAEVPPCPKCNAEDLKRVWDSDHLPLPIFKVTGFYTTDHLRKNSNFGRKYGA